MTLRLSRRARADLDDIRDYTLQTWGRDQWLRYYRGLVAAMERATENPMTGQDRSLLGDGLRSLRFERHLIFYAPVSAAGDEVVILRLVHQARYLPALSYYDDLGGA